jgi:hypothetical protein
MSEREGSAEAPRAGRESESESLSWHAF